MATGIIMLDGKKKVVSRHATPDTAKSALHSDKQVLSGSSVSTQIADSRPSVQGPAYTALLVGETGSGKSTFINYLANHFLGGRLDSLKVVIPSAHYPQNSFDGFPHPSEANIDNTSLSQTTKVAKYTFHKDNETYRFLDTPGLSSTSSESEVDDESMKAIFSAVSQEGELNAIILIMNGSMPRHTVNITNVLKRIESFPDIFRDRWIVIFTNGSASPPGFDTTALPFAPIRLFTTNNSAFSYEPATLNSVSPDRAAMDRTAMGKAAMGKAATGKAAMDKMDKAAMDREWYAAMNTIEQLTTALKSHSAISTATFTSFQAGQQKLAEDMMAAFELLAHIEELDKQLASSKLEEAKAAQHSRQKSSSQSADQVNSQDKLSQAKTVLCSKKEELKHLFEQLDDSDHDLERFQKITQLGQDCSFLRFQVNFLRETLAQTKTQVPGDEELLRNAEEKLNFLAGELEAALRSLKQISHRVNLLTEISPSKRAFENSISRLKTEKMRSLAKGFLRRVETSVEELDLQIR